MKQQISTRFGDVRIGSVIRIDKTYGKSAMFRDGTDKQATGMNGKRGTVEAIDDKGSLFGTWDGLAVLPDIDTFTVISF